MITDFFINLINNSIGSIPRLTGTAAMDIHKVGEIFNTCNYYIPVCEFIMCASAYITLIKSKIIVRLVRWVLERV